VERKDIPYVLREVILIVSGILIAFWLNAWWLDRSAYRTETDYLLRLEIDLGTTEADVEEVIQTHREKVDILQHIIALLGAGPSQARADSIAMMGYRINQYTLFNETVRAYDELVGAGRVELLTSAAIRAALQDYAYEREFNQDWDDYHSDFSVQIAEPAVLARLPIKIRDDGANALEPPSFELLTLFDDLMFWNLVRQRLDNEVGILSARLDLLESLRTARLLVGDEVQFRGR
jgi:hypothetical protein